MTRNITPRPVKASGARDAHGKIFERGAGALYVHLHREGGLAHRHYVLQPWKVRLLAILTSRPMLVVYVVALVSWSWVAGQASRVPLLQQQITRLTAEAQRLDTLTATLALLQARYDQVQAMLSAATAKEARRPSGASSSGDTTPDN